MWIEVFKTGTHTDSSGQEKTWTEEDLDKIASQYDPKKHEAPLVIGHPKDNSPAYGWVEELKREGSNLVAKIKPTVQEFIDWIKNGLYKKISIALYGDNTLRHIGFLGGTPPAIKGLKMPEFTDGDFSEYELEIVVKKEEKKIEKKTEVKKMEIDEKAFKELEEKVKTLEAQSKSYEDAIKDKDTKIIELGNRTSETQAKLRKAEHEKIVDGLIGEGKLFPVHKDRTLKNLELYYQEGNQEFAEKGTRTEFEAYKEELSKQEKLIEFKEIATKGKAKESGGDWEKKIDEYMEKNKGVSYADAMKVVSKKHPELFKEVQ